MSYAASAALRAYTTRVGAKEVSFKRYVVKEFSGRQGQRHYYEEKAVVYIDGGKIKCSDPALAPTDEERSAIEHDLAVNPPPSSVGALSIDDLRPLLSAGGDLYEVWDRKTDRIVMVQHVIVTEAGDKGYVAWSLWSDGQWRKMEPDGKLSFFKPRKRTKAARLMIHEGAKAARRAQQIVDDKVNHPWRSELSLYEHWGMLGGALNPKRVDFAEVDKDFIEVVYCCDNDERGQEAAAMVSREYGKKMRTFRPDLGFPESWDLADDLPAEMFSDGRWNGPTMKDMTRPATRATIKVKIKGSDKPVTVLTAEFKSEWVHCVQPEVYIHVDQPDTILTANEFNHAVAPYSDVDDTSRLIKKVERSLVNCLQYVPGKRSGIYVSHGKAMFNTHQPTFVTPRDGSPTPFIDFMEHLVPDPKDRHLTMRWIATLIAKPERRMRYAVLMISEHQGVGKGTLGERILAPLVGMSNASFPNEQTIVDSSFTYWQPHKRLAVIPEIYSGNSPKAYNKLQSVITDNIVHVNLKHLREYDIQSWVHVFACSNSTRAIHLPDDDRRWLVPRVTEDKAYDFDRLYDWLENESGLSIIMQWAIDFVKIQGNAVGPGESAPMSERKMKAIIDSQPENMQHLCEIFRMMRRTFIDNDEDDTPEMITKRREAKEKLQQLGFYDPERGLYFVDVDVQQYMINRNNGKHDERIPKKGTICRLARKEGLYTSSRIEERMPWMPAGISAFTGDYHIICTKEETSKKSIREVWSDGSLKPLTFDAVFSQI